ncbi:MAG: type pilus assembly protein PilB [Solirubrobacterales bacterium]|jgi:type IV pilus assembly protein PilB|nr:type pilus assembly protein PilB [Solirubrobacterales bacterium]
MPRELPEYLRPVPGPGEGSAAAAEAHEPDEPTQSEISGLIPPTRRGHSSGFVTDAIVDLGFASRDQVEQAIGQSRTAGRPPEAILLEQGAIDAEQLSKATAERYGLDYVDLAIFKVDMAAANLISVKSARRHQVVPISFIDESTLLLAMADPANVLALDDVQMATGLNCNVAVAPALDIDALVSKLSTLQSTVAAPIVEDEDEEESEAEITDLRASAQDAPVVKLVNSILGQAVTEGASDIHFEPNGGEMRIRFRVDGVLEEMARVPRRMVAGVVSRVKIMSELDIAEKRIPQDGRVAVTIEERRIDLRVTTLPTQKGEGASIRILDEASALRTLDDLGMTGEERRRFEGSIRQPYGAVLVTGPTGAGKSTTLYAALQELNNVNKNIVTIEDPVEYQLDGVSQIGVHRKAGLTFATGLRSMLRADPDVIMVGEVRDSETGRIAIEAALTGHMVLTTLHTNDAPGAITRLQEMGIESFLTSSAVDCVVAQRLARVLCPHCKKRIVIQQAALEEAGFRVATDLEAYEPAGCGRCHGAGYRGRIGIYSVMVMSERIKEMVVNMASEADIAKVAIEEGMVTLRDAGLAKVRDGMTSIEEVARVAS